MDDDLKNPADNFLLFVKIDTSRLDRRIIVNWILSIFF